MKTLSYGNKRCFFSHNHCTENQIFFSQTSWKDGLSKKIALEYDLSRIIGKDHVFLSRNMILTLGGKWKMIFFKKIQGNMIFSSGPPKRRSFQERPRRDMIFFVLSGKIVFFFPKTRYFFLGRKPATTFLKKYMEMLSVYTRGCYRPGATPPCQKKSRWPCPAKIHLKVIDVLDWHPGKSPSKSL